jgi:hypothetical protein
VFSASFVKSPCSKEIMVLNFLKKKDYWSEVGNEEGYINAVKQLGCTSRELNDNKNGYTKSDSIWGQLATFTKIPKKDTYETRKWLYTTWHDDRRNIRTTFLSTEVTESVAANTHQSSNDDNLDNKAQEQMVSFNLRVLFLLPT